MSEAHKLHSLSKLDLFTPNALHPSLPPLTTGAHTNLYASNGIPATMILESDVLDRKAYIQALLGPSAEETMHRRPAAHDRIISHMGVQYYPGRGWRKGPTMKEKVAEMAKEGVAKRMAKSMWTVEARREYVRKALVKEWEAMGMRGGSQEHALVIEDEGE
jgi:hypothetical protein